jgi:hypothetical protein
MRLCVLLRSVKLTAIGNNTLTIRKFFSPRHREHIHPHARRVSTGPPGDRGALHCRCNVIATHPLGLVPFQALCILPVAEEQSPALAAAKAAALRINLNVEGCGIVAAPVHAPSCAPLDDDVFYLFLQKQKSAQS